MLFRSLNDFAAAVDGLLGPGIEAIKREEGLAQVHVSLEREPASVGSRPDRISAIVSVGTTPHPVIGVGYRPHLTWLGPWETTVEELDRMAALLAAAEARQAGWEVPRLGAWVSKPVGGLTYESFRPTAVARAEIVAEELGWMVERARWAYERLRAAQAVP